MVELLQTKLFIPRPRTKLVARPRLVERLNAGIDKKLTLIAAPVGSGKTTLLSEWVSQCPRRIAWYALEGDDNDATRFWAYFITSLQTVQPGMGENALNLLLSPQAPPITSILVSLINDLASRTGGFGVVLEDYHAIEHQAIHDTLTYLLTHLPDNVHLIITTRIDPPLPLERMRANDQMNEFRASDLRFTTDETAWFFNQAMGLNLSADDIAALEQRTEGWAAGLQIAALTIKNKGDIAEFIRGFSGSHRHILGYLVEEVINRMPEKKLDFLLKTSILERLCGSLCDAVTDGSEGQTTLQELERENLFIEALDDEGIWYRYHKLFAEVLILRLKQVRPSLEPELHRKARKWLEENCFMHEAVAHAISAKDYELAAGLIERQLGENWLAGELGTLQGWLNEIPEEAWQSYPRLWLVRAWVEMTIGDFVTADANLRAAEKTLTKLELGGRASSRRK